MRAIEGSLALILAFGSGLDAADPRVREWARLAAEEPVELKGKVIETLVRYASEALIGPTPSAPRAGEALHVVKTHLHTLPEADRKETLDLLHDVYHVVAVEILSTSLSDPEDDVRHTAAGSLLHQANHFASFPTMPPAFYSETVFQAARDSDERLRHVATCVLWLVQANLEGGPRWPSSSRLWQRLTRALPPRNLDQCE